MVRLARALALMLSALGAASALHAEEASDLLARFRTATGGAQWDAVKTLRSNGTLLAGGLSGRVEATLDLASGRSVARYTLGPVAGADGYDGQQAWHRDPGGEVGALDTPEARQLARTQAWLDARAFWYAERGEAHYGKVESKEIEGARYAVVEATPTGGAPATLWFDTRTNLLARTVDRQGQDTQTTIYQDWRNVGDLKLPFVTINDVTDAAGRTDPRGRSEIHIERYVVNVAVADADFAMPAMRVTSRIDNAAGIARVPFDLVNNHIYVDGSVDGKRARFLVDTGGVNLLTPKAAAKFGLASAGRMAARGVGDESVDLAMAHAGELRVGDAALAEPVFYVIDLGDLPKVEGVEADGLVGYETFRRFGVTIDYAAHMLTLSEPGRFVAPTGATAVPFELADRIPIVAGTLDGMKLRISIDTGSRSSLTLHSPFVREHGLVGKYDAAPDGVIGWGVGGPSRGRVARLGTLQLGTLGIAGIAGDLTLGDKGAFANPDLDANLGGGVLRRFTVAFDYANRRMYLAPNALFDKPDEFDRSGLWLLGDGDGLAVADVAASSAAAGAGLQAQDRLVSIDGESIARRTLPQWRQCLREWPAGKKLAIRYERAGVTRDADLTLADRIPTTWLRMERSKD